MKPAMSPRIPLAALAATLLVAGCRGTPTPSAESPSDAPTADPVEAAPSSPSDAAPVEVPGLPPAGGTLRPRSPSEEPTPALHAVPAKERLSDWSIVHRRPSASYNGQVECVDFDGDGRGDPTFATFSDGARVFRGTVSGYEFVWQSPDPNETQGIHWGDMDGDGVPELAMAEREELANRVWRLVDGVPTLAWTSPHGEDSKSVEWGDADGDGDLDLAVANVGRNRVYYNEGGTLGRSVVIEGDFETDALAWFDMDGDGDLDLIEGNSGPVGLPDRLLRNDDNQRFVPVAETPYGQSTNDIAQGDMDGDGTPEFAFAHAGGGDYVARVDGDGFHVLWESPDPVHNSTAIQWSDVDGDGDADLVTSSTEGVAVYRNEGESFSLFWLSDRIGLFKGLAICDLDGDGTDEWVVSNDAHTDVVFGRPEVARSWARPVSETPVPSLAAEYRAAAAPPPSEEQADEEPPGDEVAGGDEAAAQGDGAEETEDPQDPEESKAPEEPEEPILPVARFPCPDGMLGIVGDQYALGEKDSTYLVAGTWRMLTIRHGILDIRDFCVSRVPFPGEVGASWAKGGLRRVTVEVLVEKLKGTGRRLCRADELMLAAAGPWNWRHPYHPSDRLPGDDPAQNPCGTDDHPATLGTRPGCASRWGVLDFQIQSSWASTPPDLVAALAARGVDLDGQEWDYLVYGSTAEQQTWYPPTNFSVHSHAHEDPPFSDDGVRLCSDPGSPTAEQQARWSRLLAEYESAGRSLPAWLDPFVTEDPR